MLWDGSPKLPNLPKRKTANDIVWGRAGKDARWLYQFSRLLARTEESDRKLLMFMAQKMARATSNNQSGVSVLAMFSVAIANR